MVESPCVKICELNSDDICVGCGRARAEIAVWSSAPEPRKREIVDKAARRKRALDLRQPVKTAGRG